MRYVSTRGAWRDAPQPFRAILLEGLAPDGGLAVPERYPRFDEAELARLRPLDYRALAHAVLSQFIDDIPSAELRRIIDATYTSRVFGSDAVTPLATLEPGFHLLQVSNGPTLAFKDIALQLLGRLFEHVLREQGRTLNIVGATSGDTGSSAECAMQGKAGIAVFMLSPHGRMSPFQQAQMYSLQDPNIHNLAIEGTFDDCQDMVKAIAGDAAFKARYRIGAVNSINWARVAALGVY
jgi:threonine synthase